MFVLVRVHYLQALLMNMRMAMGFGVVGVLVLMSPAAVIVRRVRVHMRVAIVLVLMGVRGLMRMFFGHDAPFSAVVVCAEWTRAGISAARSRRCSRWRDASSSSTATCGSSSP
jgi:uncharacterized membrane protein